MVNFHNRNYIYFIVCVFIQLLSFNLGIEAKTSHHSNIEFTIDVDALRNCDNLEDKIDCFIDVGMQYQQATSENFDYKKFLKKAYKYLEKENIHIDKKTKKDLKKQIQNRISERFFEHKTSKTSTGQASPGQANQHNPNGNYSNEFREGIIEVCIGCVGIVSGSTSVKCTGAAVAASGTLKIINATVDYVWPEPDNRDYRRGQERERPTRDGLEAGRDRDGPMRDR